MVACCRKEAQVTNDRTVEWFAQDNSMRNAGVNDVAIARRRKSHRPLFVSKDPRDYIPPTGSGNLEPERIDCRLRYWLEVAKKLMKDG